LSELTLACWAAADYFILPYVRMSTLHILQFNYGWEFISGIVWW